MPMWYCMEKERDELEFSQVHAVRVRLGQWADYHNHRSISTPGHAYTPEDRVADSIYKARIPLPSINTPDSKLDLEVSDSIIELLLERARKGEKILFV